MRPGGYEASGKPLMLYQRLLSCKSKLMTMTVGTKMMTIMMPLMVMMMMMMMMMVVVVKMV